ncbi:organic cation transporter protein-like [Babylonia areolata]|uniref:organic cation transporter protein-like n=1 Tax=Babylonia areolata TaxID=304850 RepID=UPI003FD0C1AB
MQQEELLGMMGKWGRFQTRLVAVLSVTMVLLGFQSLIVIVTLAVPSHRCRVPGLDNDTFEIQSEWHRHLVQSSIPSTRTSDGHVTYDKCQVYVNASTYYHDVSNGSLADVNVTEVERQTIGCESWVYDRSEFESTVISYFDLVCDKKKYRAHINVAYIVGLFIGSPLSGYLCDRFGRKKTLFVGALAGLVVGVLSAFPFIPYLFIVYRILRGAVGLTMYLALFVLIVEMAGPDKRNTMGSLVCIIWSMGPFLVASISYVLANWRHLQLLSAVPYVLPLLTWRLVPESPRWLLFKGRASEAIRVVREAARLNGMVQPAEDVQVTDLPGDSQGATTSQSVRQMVRHHRLIVRTLIVFFNWGAVSMAYYGLTLNVANLGGSLRVNFLMSMAVELAGYFLAWSLLDRLGRKRTHCLTMMLAGLACLATIFPFLYLGPEHGWVLTALAMVGKLGISAAFSSLYLVSAELFPTVIRNFALGCSSTAGRVGSLTSPYIADLSLYIEGSFGKVLPLIIFGSVTVAAGLASLLLPETLGRQLPDSIEDAANFGKETRKSTPEETEMAERNGGKQDHPLLGEDEKKE